MKLIDLKIGCSGTVVRVPAARLKEIGLVPGTRVTIVSKGLFGNPLEIAFAGNYLLIDRKTAEQTEVEPCG